MVRLYKQSLDYSNIVYSIAKIKKPKCKELDIFILSIKGLNAILKMIIFINSINKGVALIDNLYIKLLNNLKNKIEQVI